MSARAEVALRGWLAELPALVPSLDQEPGVRRVLVVDALTTGDTLLRAAPKAHPLVRGHAHLSVAALDLVLAYDGDEPSRRLQQVVEHADAAVEIADAAAAPVLRVDLIPRAAALVSGCLPLAPKTKAAGLEKRVTELARAVGAALTEQADEARRGMATLAAAMTLGDGAKLVRQSAAKAAVLERAAELTHEARRALVRAGEAGRAAVAAEVAAGLEARLPH